ncbi:MAG: exodeoxyribonuclease VII large subunit, partial [Oscillospiraceae bacterium]|nr:exodeoxyribonuclease VII large subunit [Oscillospiraceae bacterium]
HMYFTLKDRESTIRCVMFKEQADKVKFFPKDGMSVVAKGDIGVYEKSGTYQIYVRNLTKQGEGDIQKELEQLTNKLLKEGLFDSDRKVAIPKKPNVVGVLTALNGAALQDVIQILSRRSPILKLKVYPALVQGENAARSIIKAINLAKKDSLDVLIIGRGGGSSEDLDPFNNEQVVRAVASFEKPVISAVGHETDRCLVDLVSDLRAPTPSAAAELVCVDIEDLKKQIDNIKNMMYNSMKDIFEANIYRLDNLKSRLFNASPLNELLLSNERLEQLKIRLNMAINIRYNMCKDRYENQSQLLESLNPLKVLSRGYSIVFDENGKVIRSVYKTKVDNNINILLNSGSIKAKITEKIKKN